MKEQELKSKLEGLIKYYSSLLSTSSLSEINNKIEELGKCTQEKVKIIAEEARVHGIVLGLKESMQLIEPCYWIEKFKE